VGSIGNVQVGGVQYPKHGFVAGTSGETLETHYSYDNAGRLLSVDGPLPGTDDASYYRRRRS
jgi:hypothetical protein